MFVAVVVPLAHEARAFILRSSEPLPIRKHSGRLAREPFEVTRARRGPLEICRNIPSGSTASERMAA